MLCQLGQQEKSDVVTLSESCVISTDKTTTLDEQRHVQEEIVIDSSGIELSQSEYNE